MSLLTLKHIFGLKGDVNHTLHYLDETTVLYPAGYNLILYHLEKKTQRFLPLTWAETNQANPTLGQVS